jgi:hypothetical protein
LLATAASHLKVTATDELVAAHFAGLELLAALRETDTEYKGSAYVPAHQHLDGVRSMQSALPSQDLDGTLLQGQTSGLRIMARAESP